jgi:uncharacterized protein (TIGR00730 family)
VVRRVGVLGGTRGGPHPRYEELAVLLGQRLAQLRVRLIFCGSSRGLVGGAARGALAHGGCVTGIVTASLLAAERATRTGVELHLVGSAHRGRMLMYHLADAFVALPGGVDTIDQLMGILAAMSRNQPGKPVVALSSNAFFAPVQAALAKAVGDGFVASRHACLAQADNVDDVLVTLGIDRPGGVPAWELPPRARPTRATT